MDLRLPPRRLGAGALALDPRDERAQAPGPAAAEVVREQLQRGVRGGARALDARPRVGVEADELALEPGARFGGRVRGLLDRLVEHALRVLDPARVEQRDAERGEDVGARGVALRGQRDRALEQGRSGRRVAAPQRAPGGAREPLHRLGDERLLAREPELGAVGAGALEVVADDLVLGVGRALQPAGQPLVEVRAAALGQAAVGDLAEQRVGEAEAVVARRALGVDQLAPHERGQRGGQVVVAERRERAAAEAPALDRGVLEQRALVRAELVEPRGQHGLDGRRQLALRADRHQLLEEQRVAVGPLDHPAGREPLGAEPRHERERVDLVERVEAEHGGAALRRRPRRPALEQLRTAEADEQDRRAAGERDQVVDEVQQRRLGPVGVVDHDDERALAGGGLEQPADRPGRLLRLGRLVGLPGGGEHAAVDHVGLLVAGEERLDVPELPDDLRQRAVREPLAVAEAAPADHERVQLRARLVGEPRLADPRRPDHGEQPHRPLAPRGGECVPELGELALAPDERGRGRPDLERGGLAERLQPPRVAGRRPP